MCAYDSYAYKRVYFQNINRIFKIYLNRKHLNDGAPVTFKQAYSLTEVYLNYSATFRPIAHFLRFSFLIFIKAIPKVHPKLFSKKLLVELQSLFPKF